MLPSVVCNPHHIGRWEGVLRKPDNSLGGRRMFVGMIVSWFASVIPISVLFLLGILSDFSGPDSENEFGLYFVVSLTRMIPPIVVGVFLLYLRSSYHTYGVRLMVLGSALLGILVGVLPLYWECLVPPQLQSGGWLPSFPALGVGVVFGMLLCGFTLVVLSCCARFPRS